VPNLILTETLGARRRRSHNAFINNFDVLSEEGEELEEENAPREKSPGQTEDAQEPQRAPTLIQDPRGKAQMSLTDQEAEREESDLQLALDLSRVEAKYGRKGEIAHMSLTDQEAEREESDL
jgi:hypothetical protein